MGWLTVVYGVCLLLCLISTGVTTTFGFVARFEKLPLFRKITFAPARSAVVAAFIIVLSMTISLVGLSNIIKYGYGYCGYFAIAVVILLPHGGGVQEPQVFERASEAQGRSYEEP